MLSVHLSTREPEPSPPCLGGHLVLAIGISTGNLVIHNASGFPDDSQRFAHISWETFDRCYAGRGVVLGSKENDSVHLV